MANDRSGSHSANSECKNQAMTVAVFKAFQRNNQQLMQEMHTSIAQWVKVVGKIQVRNNDRARNNDEGRNHLDRNHAHRQTIIDDESNNEEFNEIIIADQGGGDRRDLSCDCRDLSSKDCRMKVDLPSVNGQLQIKGFLD